LIRIQQGIFRGRAIQQPPIIHGECNITTGLLKEAAFQLIENFREGREFAFFDLCAGSGQIGLEALSRGFSPVHLCELDQNRFAFLLKEIKKYNYQVQLHKKAMQRLAPLVAQTQYSVSYIDLPYSFWSESSCKHIDDFFLSMFASMQETQLDKKIKEALFLIQGPVAYHPEKEIGERFLQTIKVYRGNVLTILKIL